MAIVTRLDNNTALNLGPAWSNPSVPGNPPGASDVATWNGVVTNLTTALGGAVSWGGIALGSSQAGNITVGTTAAALTLGSSGVDMSSAGANLTLASPVTISLTADQSWNVGSGRTLTVSSVTSSTTTTRVLTKTGSGTLALQGSNNFGGSGGGFVANGGLTIASNTGSLGSASNTVTVNNGGAIQFTALPNQATINVAGSGASGAYGAVWIRTSFATKTVNVTANNTVLSFRQVSGPTITASTALTNLYLNAEFNAANNTSTVPTTPTSTYSVSGSVILQSLNAADGTTPIYNKFSTATGTGAANDLNNIFGANTNAVTVDTTGGISVPGTGTTTFSRNYTFISKPYDATYTQFRKVNDGRVVFASGSTVTVSGTGYVQFAGGSATQYIQFAGVVQGTANINIDATAEFAATSTITGWSGALTASNINYYRDIPNAVTYDNTAAVLIDNLSGAPLTVNHASYARTSGTSTTYVGSGLQPLTLATGTWTGAPGTWAVSASTLTLNISLNSTTGAMQKSGAGKLVLAGSNTSVTGMTWNASGGDLTLNHANAIGTGSSASFTVASVGGILDSTTGVTLNQSGAIFLNANFAWAGTSDLTFGPGAVTWNAARIFTFTGSGTGTLKFSGNATTTTATYGWDVGNGVAGAKQRLTLVGANAWAPVTTNAAVSAGYFQIQNANGLGAAASTTTWFVGMTAAGVTAQNAALELSGGITVPATKNGSFRGTGPDTDGALRSVSGTNVWQGAILVPMVAGTRIQVDAGSLTLDPAGSPAYTTIAPTNANTPMEFAAKSGATLNQDRILSSNVGNVTCNSGVGATGTVVLSKANNHSGTTTCVNGTTKITHANATGTGTGNGVVVKAGATLQIAVASTYKATFAGTSTLGQSGVTPAILKIGI